MQFHITKSQKDIQKAAKEFARGEFEKSLCLEMEKSGEFYESIRRKAAELGFLAVHFPEEQGGIGLGMLETALVAEAFCERDASAGIVLMLSGFGAECLLRFGSDEQKSALLPGILSGTALCATAFAETAASFGLAGISTTARKEPGHWVIDGHKAQVLNAGAASFYLVLCRIATNGDAAAAGQTGIFLVEADREGISVVNSGRRFGLRMIKTGDLCMEKVHVNGTNLLGKLGQGLQQALWFSMHARILISALALGTARGAFLRALDYTGQRVQFGKKIGQFPVIRQKLAQMALLIEESALLTYSAAWHFDQGKSDDAMVAMAKLSACNASVQVASEAVQLLGGYGYMAEYEVERYLREAKVLSVLEGNSLWMNDLIAQKLMGKMR